MKKLTPLVWLLCTVALASAGVWLLGNASMRRPDEDPLRVEAGAVLSHLRYGRRFFLADAYPQEWETAQFAASWKALESWEFLRLMQYSPRFADMGDDEPLLLLWKNTDLVTAIPMPNDQSGYPRFADALGNDSFRLPREEAEFLCTFVTDESGQGGYYECRPAGIPA